MKKSKDNKAEGSKQSKGRGAEPQESGALFPRLHVKETKNAGPRAPPRNKMALYEQLTVPAHRFVHPSTKPSSAAQTALNVSYSAQAISETIRAQEAQHSHGTGGKCPYNGGLAIPMYMAPPMPFPAMGVGHHSLGPASMANHTNESVDCQAELHTVPNFSHLASSSISLGAAPSLATPGHRREKNVPRPGEDYGVSTFSSDMVEQIALTDRRLGKENLSGLQPPGQNVGGGTDMANVTPDLCFSELSETMQMQSQLGVQKNVPLKSSKVLQELSQGHKDEAGNNESGSKECGPIGEAVILQSTDVHHSLSQLPQLHESDNSARVIHGYQADKMRFESFADHQVSGSGGPAPGDIILVARQDYLECRKNSGNLRVSGEVFNTEQRKVSCIGENIREVASIHNVREAEISHPCSSNSSEGTGDVENQTDGSGVEISEPSQLRGEETSDDSDSSMIDLSPLAKVLPKDVIGAVGQHEFWKMRKAIFKQQRIFAMQLFELHRLVKVQEIMADSPSVPTQEVSDCHPAGFSVRQDLNSLAVPDIPATKDEEKEIEYVDDFKSDSFKASAVLQVPHIPGTAHLTENTQIIHPEQQAQMYAAAFSFPVMPGQPNPWVYTPHLNTSLNYWAGAMAAGPVAHGYQPYRPFPSFYAPISAYNGPCNPIANVPSPFNIPQMYPLVGYPQQPDIYMNTYQNNCSSSNPQWHSSIQSSSPLDPTKPASYPYIPPFVVAGQGGGSDAKGYVDCPAVTRAPPAATRAPPGVGQMISSGLSSSERLDTPSMEASRWTKNPVHFQHGEPYAPFFACQQPMYCPPRGFHPVLTPSNAEHNVHTQASQFRGQNTPESAVHENSFSGTPVKMVENMNHEQEQLVKRHKEGCHAGKMIQNEDKLDMGTDVSIRSKAPNVNPENFSVLPWGSIFNQFDYRKHHMSDGHHERLIKVVPRAMLATPESAAEILHSIQQERQ